MDNNQRYEYEPSRKEMVITQIVGNILGRRYYTCFVQSLEIKKNDKVLDFCSGSGVISKKIAKRLGNGQLIFTDISEKWLAFTRKKLRDYKNAKGITLDNFHSKIAGGEYDKIIIHFSLHDFPCEFWLQIMNQLVINLKQNGIIVICEPLSKTHGMKLYELINLLEQSKLINYRYNISTERFLGEYIDVRCWLKKIY